MGLLFLGTTPLLLLLQTIEACLLLWARPGLEIGHICTIDWGKVGRCGGVRGDASECRVRTDGDPCEDYKTVLEMWFVPHKSFSFNFSLLFLFTT